MSVSGYAVPCPACIITAARQTEFTTHPSLGRACSAWLYVLLFTTTVNTGNILFPPCHFTYESRDVRRPLVACRRGFVTNNGRHCRGGACKRIVSCGTLSSLGSNAFIAPGH